MGKQYQDHTGDIGSVVIEGETGPVHVGNGNVYSDTTVTTGGDERTFPADVTVVSGDHHGTISHRY